MDDQTFRDEHSDIPWVTRSSTGYETRRRVYHLSNKSIPKAIACPRGPEDVAQLVRHARTSNIAVTVRSGGHDIYGRSMAQDVLCIDVRAIDFVDTASDRKSARIGAGVSVGRLVTELNNVGLTTVFPGTSSIGYIGWATLGGYGNLTAEKGLGIDQIVEAEVVDSHGQIIEADKEMLKGIRGGGGNFGVIVSLRIKVFQTRKLLAGNIIYDSSQKGIAATFAEYMTGFQSLSSSGQIPATLGTQAFVINHPQAGRTFMVNFIWSSPDHDVGREHLAKLASLAPVAMDTVAEVSIPDWTKQTEAALPYGVWGGSQGISFRTLSPNVLAIIGRHLETMPTDPSTIIATHSLDAQSPSCTDPMLKTHSSFNPELRQGHILIELIGTVLDESKMQESQAWIKNMYLDLLGSGEALDGSYVSLSNPENTTVEKLYGSEWEGLVALKKKLDPKGVFRYAVPRLFE